MSRLASFTGAPFAAPITGALRASVACLQHSAARFAAACLVALTLALVGYAPNVQNASHAAQLAKAEGDAANQSLYALIFSAQDKGDFTRADALIAQLSDTRLLGYVLAQRYSSSQYHASAAELADWLTRYADHPQLGAMMELAKRAGVAPHVLASVTVPDAPLSGAGNVEQLGRSEMPNGWYHGLNLWKARNYSAAAASFQAIAQDDSLGDWHRAAGAYWEYRSLAKLGQTRAANQALLQAAGYPETFYGILANAQRGEPLRVAAHLPDVPAALLHDGAIARAQWLAALDRDADAEAELRQRYASLSGRERAALVTIAAQLNLPNLQLRLARNNALTEAEALAARYPIPAPMLSAQHTVDPALLLAVAMHESGFRESVKSGGGAVGMMQMLPSTAQHVALASSGMQLASADSNDGALSIHDRLNDMAMSTRLGATYFTMLRREPAVGNNMIHLLAAYNAGPGTVKSWQKAAKNITDPLLYLESIPYPETHNYVAQVMAHVWMYQALLGEKPSGLQSLARGAWPMLHPMHQTNS